MNAPALDGALLASVSRSFYLTIRLLPAQLRAPISLAYLLARASDTIADTDTASGTIRARHLKAFGEMLRNTSTKGVAEIGRDIRPQHAGERHLISRLDECILWLGAQDAADRDEIVGVLEKIIAGQTLDLQRFAGKEAAALASAAELEEYTYLVAGCVGEFWTRIGIRHLRRFTTRAPEELCGIGVDYGKGLQLVNILRDLRADLSAGRCYLPADELRAANIDPASLLSSPEKARPVVERWLRRACDYLDCGRQYIEAIRPARVRAGCFLPWHLGVKTVALMCEQSPLEAQEKIKVSRREVRRALLLAAPVALSNWPLRRLARAQREK